VFGLAVERSENYGGDFDVWVTLETEPRSEEAAEFVEHLRRLLEVHLGGHGLVAAAADGGYAAAVGASLEDLVAMNSYAAGHLEGGFWARMELLGLGLLLHALSELEPQVLADWWALYADAGGDPLELLDALEATTV
jgi:hypothetical protein